MFNNYKFSTDLNTAYEELITNNLALITAEENTGANLANSISLLNYFLTDINWVGIYMLEEVTNDLVLSHFNGLPACTRLFEGKGVCQKSVSEKNTIVVKDVHDFEGHIACDSASVSEIVVPIFKDEKVIGVLDIDSPISDRFSEIDKINLEKYVKNVLERIINE